MIKPETSLDWLNPLPRCTDRLSKTKPTQCKLVANTPKSADKNLMGNLYTTDILLLCWSWRVAGIVCSSWEYSARDSSRGFTAWTHNNFQLPLRFYWVGTELKTMWILLASINHPQPILDCSWPPSVLGKSLQWTCVSCDLCWFQAEIFKTDWEGAGNCRKL